MPCSHVLAKIDEHVLVERVAVLRSAMSRLALVTSVVSSRRSIVHW